MRPDKPTTKYSWMAQPARGRDGPSRRAGMRERLRRAAEDLALCVGCGRAITARMRVHLQTAPDGTTITSCDEPACRMQLAELAARD